MFFDDLLERQQNLFTVMRGQDTECRHITHERRFWEYHGSTQSAFSSNQRSLQGLREKGDAPLSLAARRKEFRLGRDIFLSDKEFRFIHRLSNLSLSIHAFLVQKPIQMLSRDQMLFVLANKIDTREINTYQIDNHGIPKLRAHVFRFEFQSIPTKRHQFRIHPFWQSREDISPRCQH